MKITPRDENNLRLYRTGWGPFPSVTEVLKITPRDENNLRLYRTGWGLFPSVTEVLKITQGPHIENWRRRVGREKADRMLQNATVFGKRLHVAAEAVAWDRWEDVEPDLLPY